MSTKKSRTPKRQRRLRLEALENRKLLAADILCNFDMPTDVNNDSRVSPLDALSVLNHLSSAGQGEGEARGLGNSMFVDVNADGRVTPTDALRVLNSLSGSGSGASTVTPLDPASDPNEGSDSVQEASNGEPFTDGETDNAIDAESEDDADEMDPNDSIQEPDDMNDDSDDDSDSDSDGDSGEDSDVNTDGKADDIADDDNDTDLPTDAVTPVETLLSSGSQAEAALGQLSGAETEDDDSAMDEQEVEFSAMLVSVDGASAEVEFEMLQDTALGEMEFEVEVDGAIPNSVMDVLVAGVLVGQIAVDANGSGELELGGDDEDSLALPPDFPVIFGGVSVSVGTSLSGNLQIEQQER